MPHSCLSAWLARTLPLALTSLLALPLCRADAASVTGTTSFILDGNRMYAELRFLRADGSAHRALAFVDMGSPGMTLKESLFEELQLDQHRPLRFKVGNLLVEVPESDLTREPGTGSSMNSRLKVEAILSAGILRNYRVQIDYHEQTLTLSQHQAGKPKGVPVPFQINADTGLIAVPARIDGKAYWISIDNGSAYTWIRQSAARVWLRSHSDWKRGTGAVGPSNMMMSGDSTETEGMTRCMADPAQTRTLILQRSGRRFAVKARVTRF